MTQNNYVNLVFAGHVDHGKSTLIGRILLDTGTVHPDRLEEVRSICEALGKDLELGYLMDHLQEEREQGITIDTAQTFFTWKNRQFVIIDAPGHVEFIRNMVTGASHADAAVLIVDANEGVKEQTKRHAYLLGLIGVREIIVTINKMDLIGYSEIRFQKVKKDIEQMLADINLSPKWVLPISAKEGTGVSKPHTEGCTWFNGPILLDILEEIEGKRDLSDLSLRFMVQDVYNYSNRIAVGKVIRGTLSKGMPVIIHPTGQKTHINSLEVFEKTIDKAEPGSAIGITTQDKVFIERGFVLSDIDSPPIVTDSVHARIFWMDKENGHIDDDFFIRCATQEVRGRIKKIYQVIDASTLTSHNNSHEISNLEVADVLIHTEKPIVIDAFEKTPEIGRFVMVRNNPCAGGIIIGDGRCL